MLSWLLPNGFKAISPIRNWFILVRTSLDARSLGLISVVQMHLKIKITAPYIKCLATKNWVDVAPWKEA